MSEYAKGGRDVRDLDRRGGYFSRHMDAMTVEDLNEKGDIAAELAWRDYKIAELERKMQIMKCALRKLSCLGNGERPGNSIGNTIAQEALEDTCQK